MHTNFYSKLGICVRLMIFACKIGVSEIDFVGLDGPSYIFKGQHAFEKGKKTLPKQFSLDTYKYQYDVFWKYITQKFKKVKFKNLGFGQEYHK